MKNIWYLLFLFSFLQGYAQEKKITTNKIDNVKTLNIYGKSKVIIGKVIINQPLSTKAYLISLSQTKDSSDTYTSIIDIDNKEKTPLFGLDITLMFDKPVLSVDPSLIGQGSFESFSDDHLRYKLKVDQVNNQPFIDPKIRITVTGKQKFITTISGVVGK